MSTDEFPVAYLREVDAGTDNACWVVCAKGDRGARAAYLAPPRAEALILNDYEFTVESMVHVLTHDAGIVASHKINMTDLAKKILKIVGIEEP